MSTDTEKIKERLNIADIVGEYVPLKQIGGHFKGLCPFHHEKTPSFIVSPDKGIWHCFGCNSGGDVFTFVQQIEGLDFPGALKTLAERAGVQLTRTTTASVSGGRDRLFELLELAARVYHDILLRHAASQQAREYLTSRGVTQATLQTFQVGYAPLNWHTIQTFLAGKGFTDREMVDAGMLIRTPQGKVYDRFRGRIMFPIHNIQGRVVGFGGRILPQHATGHEGKYINSPETSVYEKGRNVYNLNRAKQAIRHQRHAIVVEGYMDVAMLVQSGIEHVVASSGTAFTPAQIELLKRFAPRLHFAFDGDSAGLHAAIGATDTALASGMRVATLLFSGNQDPADVALKDPEQLTTIVSRPRSLLTVVLDQLEGASAEEREGLVRDILPLMRSVTNLVQQGEMIQELAHALHVPESAIFTMVRNAPLSPTTVHNPVVLSGSSLAPTTEQHLIGLCVLEPEVRSQAIRELGQHHFSEEASRRIFARFTDTAPTLSTDELLDTLDAPQLAFAEACRQLVLAQRATSGLAVGIEADTIIRSLKRRRLEEQLQALQQQVGEASTADRPKLLQEFQTVAQALDGLKR